MSEVTEAKKECNMKVKKLRRVLDICVPAGYEPSAVSRNYWKELKATCIKEFKGLLTKIEVVIKSTEAVSSVAPSPNTPVVSAPSAQP